MTNPYQWLSLTSCAVIIRLCLASKHAIDSDKHPVYKQECIVWDNISLAMEREQNVDLDCQRNTECSGMDCIGKYNVSLLDMIHIEKDFCSGLILEACSQPTKVQMYVVMFNANHNSTQETEMTITNNTEVPIKGAVFSIYGNRAQFVMDIRMNHTVVHGRPHIFLQAFMRVKVQARLFGMEYEQYLDGFEVGIVRGMYIPIPDCDPHVGNHTHRPGRCNWQNINQLKRIGPKTNCRSDEMESCAAYEMCEHNTCVCIPGYIYNKQHCAPDLIEDFEPEIVDGDTGQSTKISKKQIIIIMCSIGAVLVLSALIATVVIKYKHYRARYGQHQLVLQEDDDPEVEA